jgi:hypothetical protein
MSSFQAIISYPVLTMKPGSMWLSWDYLIIPYMHATMDAACSGRS